jgi:integrase
MVKGARYREIWNLTDLFSYIRKGPRSDQLSLKQLRRRLAFLLMTLVPCRPVAIWKMEVEGEKWAEDGNSVEVPTKEKTNHGRQGTVLVIRKCEVENWCPLTCYKLARATAARDGVPNMLWYTEQGKPYKQASVISREVKSLMVEGRIDRSFPAYSARHALITLLIKLGFTEVEVNAFTGHSNNSHTALNHYFHLDGNWAGRRIVQEALRRAP